jgi:hypothetical protein
MTPPSIRLGKCRCSSCLTVYNAAVKALWQPEPELPRTDLTLLPTGNRIRRDLLRSIQADELGWRKQDEA